MRSILSVLACAGAAAAGSFQDTSPFLLFSSSEILFPSPPHIATSQSLTRTLEDQLSKCPSDIYILAQQRGVSAADYSTDADATFSGLAPYLTGADTRVRSSFSVAQVHGHVDTGALRSLLQDRCGAGSMHLDARLGLADLADEARPRVITLHMDDLPAAGPGRRAQAHVNELYLASVLDILPTSNFTVVYTTTPLGEGEGKGEMQMGVDGQEEDEQELNLQYEMDHADGYVHMELRRDVHGDVVARASGKPGGNGTVPENAPLFEKYQFFTPGLFMAFPVAILLMVLLYVAISAIGGMEVSYAAFDKENGPSAQRKQQ